MVERTGIMADKAELQARLEFRKTALAQLREAYLALVSGGVKSYTIDDRTLTKFDIHRLKKEIADMENEVDALESMLNGKKARKAFGVVPRDW
jgi:hypothetical protein